MNIKYTPKNGDFLVPDIWNQYNHTFNYGSKIIHKNGSSKNTFIIYAPHYKSIDYSINIEIIGKNKQSSIDGYKYKTRVNIKWIFGTKQDSNKKFNMNKGYLYHND